MGTESHFGEAPAFSLADFVRQESAAVGFDIPNELPEGCS